MTRRLLKYIGWGFITAAGYRVTRGYNETRPPVCLKVNNVSFINFFVPIFFKNQGLKVFCQQTSSDDKTPSDIFRKSLCQLNLSLFNHMNEKRD